MYNKILALIVFAMAVLVGNLVANNYINAAIPSNYNAGITTGANASISKTIKMFSEREIAFILKNTGGNFANQLLNVSVSADNTTYHRADSVSTGTSNYKVLEYSDTNKGAGLAINPAIFPFIKVEFPQIINKTITLTWSAVQ